MQIKSLLLAGSLAAALVAAPALGATLSGEVVAVGPNTITIMTGGETVTLIVPGGVQVTTPQQQQVDIAQIRSGQRVTLTVEDQAQAQADAKRTVRDIVVEGDLEIENEVDHDVDRESD